MNKFYEAHELKELLLNIRAKGLKIGLSHGVFDLIHPGHIQHFIAAKKEVDVLIVSLTADLFVNKGPGRPIFNEEIRIKTLSALEAVNFITISRDKTAESIIELIQPDVYFKGSDYKSPGGDPTGKIENEVQSVKKFGGKIVFTNELTSSSSQLINSFFNSFERDTQNWIRDFKNHHSIPEIDHFLQKLSTLEIALVGEVILDKYTTVEALGKSSKDPILAFNLMESSTMVGGILAIANNCASWVKKVKVYSTINIKDEQTTQLTKELNPTIELELTRTEAPTIVKHRFIDISTNTKVFETYNFNPDTYLEGSLLKFLSSLSDIADSDMVLIADYGHGLMDKSILTKLLESCKYISVNTQANAGNRGYNTISRYKGINFFTANGGELQLEMRSRNLDFSVVVPKLMESLGCRKAVLTIGGEGVIAFEGERCYRAPALAQRIVDKVGAGDSVFAISSLLAYVDTPPMIIGLLSNIVAAHEVSQLGHNQSLKIGDIRKQIRSLLG